MSQPSSSARAAQVIRFGDSRVDIACIGSLARRMVEVLFGDRWREEVVASAAPHYVLTSDSTGLTLTQGPITHCARADTGAAAELLMTCVLHDLADHNAAGLILHAAAVSWQGVGVLFPGVSGVGKSTLSAWLTSAGFDYLSDEMVLVPTGTRTLEGFNRALHLKRPLARAIQPRIEPYLCASSRDHDYFDDERGTLVPPQALRAGMPFSTPELRLVLFPEYRAGSAFTCEKLSAAQASAQLMGCLINARNLDGHGLPEAARLSKQVAAYRIRYSEPGTVQHAIVGMA